MSDPQISLNHLIQIVRNQAAKALLRCPAPYGGGAEGDIWLTGIVDEYLETGEYEHIRHRLRKCPPEFRQAFFRICRYDPRLSTRVQIKAFLRFSRLIVRNPEFISVYQGFFREATINGRVSHMDLFHRTLWYFKVEQPQPGGAPKMDSRVSRFLAEYSVLISPHLPNTFNLRKLRYTGRHKLAAEDEMALPA